MMASEMESTDVVICGCGPTGAMLAALLGRMGISSIVIEQGTEIADDPRAINIHADSVRMLQTLNLYECLFTELGYSVEKVHFLGGVHSDLHTKPFLSFDMTSTEGHTGQVGMVAIKQPLLESKLRDVATRSEHCQIRTGCTVTAIREDDDYAFVTYKNPAGAEKQVRGQFLVGTDGKKGFVRKQYLEPKGVKQEFSTDVRYDEVWIALNWKMTMPTPESHPSFPLWKLGYTPEQAYELFFPASVRLLCNPARPAMCTTFGLPEDRLWRAEYLVEANEDPEEMASPENMRKVLYPYLTHPGSRYGLGEDVQFPEDCIQVLRCSPYHFEAKSCNKWALGRVALCGDAAHVFPPFGAQGITSGFRDVNGLAWRLALLCSSNKRLDHDRILAGWWHERKQQLDLSLASTVFNGSMMTSRSVLKNTLRSWMFWAMRFFPSIRTQIELGPRADEAITYKHSSGMPFLPDLKGGVLFPQTYCVAANETSGVMFTDDAIFSAWKKKHFQIVVLLNDVSEKSTAAAVVDTVSRASSHLEAGETTYFIPRASAGACSVSDERLFRSASGGEFAESPLCDGRHKPRKYNELLMWEFTGARYVIVRRDRFTFAACSTQEELERAAAALEQEFS